jgi:peptidoglycan/xylan/chitin deacetylase (PgdA/CDA1 family)
MQNDPYPDMYAHVSGEFEPEAENVVYYTFDDGPSKNTVEILDILKEKNAKATFFVTGQGGEEYEEVLRRMVAEGHGIGLHTYSHDYRKIYSSVENYLEDFNRIRMYVKEVTGLEPSIFRFPGGSAKSSYASEETMREIRREMRRRGYLYYDWNVVSGDDKAQVTPSQTLVENILKGAEGKPRVVVLCHDDGMRTSAAETLSIVIDALREKGYAFKKITEHTRPIQFSNHDEEA